MLARCFEPKNLNRCADRGLQSSSGTASCWRFVVVWSTQCTILAWLAVLTDYNISGMVLSSVAIMTAFGQVLTRWSADISEKFRCRATRAGGRNTIRLTCGGDLLRAQLNAG
jgi:hypothetical protein